MAASPFLNKDGLSHLWNSLKSQLAEKSDVGHSHDEATTTEAGFMSASDKALLEGLGVHDATIE